MKKKQKHSVLKIHKTMPCPTGTKVHKDKKKAHRKGWCRKKDLL